uniref:Uncharacterized protein n=1 Tax=viral metagenome TaxID=1070528 RepID=A0A6H1ZH44_9ZZZZ
MTPNERIKLAEHILDCDAAFEADCIHMPDSKHTDREKMMADLISRLYTLIHPTGSCKNPHTDWEEENEKELKEITNQTK